MQYFRFETVPDFIAGAIFLLYFILLLAAIIRVIVYVVKRKKFLALLWLPILMFLPAASFLNAFGFFIGYFGGSDSTLAYLSYYASKIAADPLQGTFVVLLLAISALLPVIVLISLKGKSQKPKNTLRPSAAG